MNINNLNSIFFIGIGGIGMSALARYFNIRGITVSGYDRTATELTKQLISEGMNIHFEDNITRIPEKVDLVVYTPAIPKNHRQFNYFLQNNFTVKKRSEILEILSENKFIIAVGGSHGKTTVSSMIAHILKHSGYDCTAFLGGIATNYNSNFINGNNDTMVIEADEFDRSFLKLKPNIAVITAVDTDHLDIYGSKENIEDAFYQFTQNVKKEGKVVVNENVSILSKITTKKITYGWNNADAVVNNVKYQNGEMSFDIEIQNLIPTVAETEIRNISLPMSGSHNAENALAAATVASLLNISPKNIKNALLVFKGIKRRFEFIIKRDDFVFIDDYAHHPEEIKRFLASVKELFSEKKVTAIFQPHLFSRTNDLQNEFAEALNIADKIILLEIYPARELPMEGVTSELIFDKIKNNNKILLNKTELLDYLKTNTKPDVLCTVGAGDIDKIVNPLKKLYAE